MIKKIDIVMIISSSLFAMVVGAVLTLAACGGGGSSAVPTATISGTANGSTATAKPGVKAVSYSAIGGSTVTAVDSTTGNVCALSTCTTTTSSDPNSLGQFTLTVPGNNTYVITVSAMRAIVTVGTGSGPQVTVNPASEAAVQILETKHLSVTAGTLGKQGHKFDDTISGVDVNGEIQTIDNSGEPTTVAQAVLTALESCLPPQGAAGVANALSHIEDHHGGDNHHGDGHGGGHDSGTGTSSGTGTGTSSGTSTGTASGTGTDTSTSTTSNTGTATGTGSNDDLDSEHDHFCHRGGSGTGTSFSTHTVTETETFTTINTGTGTSTNTNTSTTSGTGTGTSSNTNTSTTSGTGTGTGSNTSSASSTGTGSNTGTTTSSKVSTS